jgi:hypothetical protein
MTGAVCKLRLSFLVALSSLQAFETVGPGEALGHAWNEVGQDFPPSKSIEPVTRSSDYSKESNAASVGVT